MMSHNGKKPVILFVEDEELLAQMYQYKFIHEGYECHIAHDGDEGLRKAREVHPDIILSDILMPKKDGITFLEELKKDAKLKDIPVIMLTNLSERNFVDRAIELGAVSYMVKSHTVPSGVIQKVKDILLSQGKLE